TCRNLGVEYCDSGPCKSCISSCSFRCLTTLWFSNSVPTNLSWLFGFAKENLQNLLNMASREHLSLFFFAILPLFVVKYHAISSFFELPKKMVSNNLTEHFSFPS